MSEAVDVEAVKAGPDWKKAKATFGSREWRLDNLYFIEDEKGETVLFQRNEAQRAYSPKRWWRDAIVKARQLGFSTFLAMLMLDLCIFRSGQRAAVVDVTLNDAKKKLAKIKFAYDRLPQAIRDAVPLIKANTEELQFGNGSHISVGTDYRGSTLQFLHISEFGKIASDTPARAEALKTGAMRAVHATGIIAVESTAHGTSGEFAGLVNRAKATAATGAQLTALDYRLHFYGWWIKREYRLPNNLVLITAEHRKYFAEIAPKLLDRHGVVLDADQQAWYVKNLEDLGPDKMKEEFPSIVEETFFNSLQGAFWKNELNKARAEGRIGQMVPWDPQRRVNTFSDIGEDCTAIIFHQTDGLRHRFIDYYEEEGWSLQGYCGKMDEKRRERGFIYGKHLGPHDFGHRVWGNHAKTKKDLAAELGVNVTVVPQISDKGISIEAARQMLNLSWVDQEHCSLLIERWENYTKVWNKSLGVFTSEPVHNMASHGSDALQNGACGLAPEKVDKPRRHSIEAPRQTSQWSA